MRLTCTLHFLKPTEQERENISQFKKALYIVAEANDIDLKIEESREWREQETTDGLSFILIFLGGLSIASIIGIILYFSVQAFGI
jgi:hypothetical protein